MPGKGKRDGVIYCLNHRLANNKYSVYGLNSTRSGNSLISTSNDKMSDVIVQRSVSVMGHSRPTGSSHYNTSPLPELTFGDVTGENLASLHSQCDPSE